MGQLPDGERGDRSRVEFGKAKDVGGEAHAVARVGRTLVNQFTASRRRFSSNASLAPKARRAQRHSTP
jgi:hypothetical protein